MITLNANQLTFAGNDFATGSVAGNPGEATRTLTSNGSVFEDEEVVVVTFNSDGSSLTRIDVFDDQAAFDAAQDLDDADTSYWDQNNNGADAAAGNGNPLQTQTGFEGDTFKAFTSPGNFREDGNGEALSPGGNLLFAPGSDIANATAPEVIAVDSDGDGDESFNPFDIPCFAIGTMILTPFGSRPIEDLEVGDRVVTRDRGAQEIRWIGRRTVAASGHRAPVVIAEGTYGNRRNLMVSPNHRMVISGRMAEALFGEPEFLVAAIDLIDGDRVYRKNGGMITYIHIAFDNHEIIYAEGALTESLLPMAKDATAFGTSGLRELQEIFPELLTHTEEQAKLARPALDKVQARLLI